MRSAWLVQLGWGKFVAIMIIGASVSGCGHPILNIGKLKAMKAEASSLIQHYRSRAGHESSILLKSDWPPVIASLDPDMVVVSSRNVNIVTATFFDGGWGYDLPRSKRDLPMPVKCYSEPITGVFWHGPC